VAISPDVVSVFCRYFRPCDLLWSSGVRNVARKASSVSPDRDGGDAVPEGGSPGPSPRLPVPGRGFSFCAASVGGLIGTVLF
jgi:hypothetical protein